MLRLGRGVSLPASPSGSRPRSQATSWVSKTWDIYQSAEFMVAIHSRMTRLKSDAIAGRKVSDKCLEDLATFKIARSLNINLDVTLGE